MRICARFCLIAVVLAVCVASATAQTVNTIITVSNFVSATVNVKRITVTPFMAGPAYQGSWLSPYIPPFTPANTPSLTNGTVTVSNLIMNYAYTVNISDGYTNVIGQFFPDSRIIGTNATIYAGNYVSVNVNPNGPYAIPYLPSYSSPVVSNITYTVNGSVVAGTNVTVTSNGSVYTINVPTQAGITNDLSTYLLGVIAALGSNLSNNFTTTGKNYTNSYDPTNSAATALAAAQKFAGTNSLNWLNITNPPVIYSGSVASNSFDPINSAAAAAASATNLYNASIAALVASNQVDRISLTNYANTLAVNGSNNVASSILAATNQSNLTATNLYNSAISAIVLSNNATFQSASNFSQNVVGLNLSNDVTSSILLATNQSNTTSTNLYNSALGAIAGTNFSNLTITTNLLNSFSNTITAVIQGTNTLNLATTTNLVASSSNALSALAYAIGQGGTNLTYLAGQAGSNNVITFSNTATLALQASNAAANAITYGIGSNGTNFTIVTSNLLIITNNLTLNNASNALQTAITAAFQATNATTIAAVNTASNLLQITKQPASTTLTNLSVTGAETNSLNGSSSVILTTNNGAITFTAPGGVIQTNGMTPIVYFPTNAFMSTTLLPGLTNLFLTSIPTNATNLFLVSVPPSTTNGVMQSTNGTATGAFITNSTFAGNGYGLNINFLPATNIANTVGANVTNLNAVTSAGLTNLVTVTSNALQSASLASNVVQSVNLTNIYNSALAAIAGTNTGNLTITTNIVNSTSNALAALAYGIGLGNTNLNYSIGQAGTNLTYAVGQGGSNDVVTASNNLTAAMQATNTITHTDITNNYNGAIAAIGQTNIQNLIITTGLVNSATVAISNSLTGYLPQTNGRAVSPYIADLLTIGVRTNFFITTNMIGVVGNGAGTYEQIGVTGTYTNYSLPAFSVLYSSGNWYLNSNGTSLYATTNANGGTWTTVSGIAPVPFSGFGMYFRTYGVKVTEGLYIGGYVVSTNILFQITNAIYTYAPTTNSVLNLIAQYASSPTNGTTGLQVTNIVLGFNYVSTNGNTGTGQIPYSTNTAPGYYWGAAPSGGGGGGSGLGPLSNNIAIGVGNNFSSTSNSFIIGNSNTATAFAGPSSIYNSVMEGNANYNGSGGYGTILNGVGNALDSYQFEEVLDGSNNFVHGEYSFIGNGFNNSVNPQMINSFSYIMSGSSNSITIGAVDSSILNGNNNLIQSTFSTILGGSYNSILIAGSTDSKNSSILGGYGNVLNYDGNNSFIMGSSNNVIGGMKTTGQFGLSVIGSSNLVFASSVNGTADNSRLNIIGSYNVATNANGVTLIGNYITAPTGTSNSIAIGAGPMSLTTTNQIVIIAPGGIGLNTNASGGYGVEASGTFNVAGTISQNGVPVSTNSAAASVYEIATQGSTLPTAIHPAICYTDKGGQFCKTNTTLDNSGWYQMISDHP